jgi:hypothetical protein
MIFCNTKYLFYNCSLLLLYCAEVCNLSICRRINRQYKYNLLSTVRHHQRPYRRIPLVGILQRVIVFATITDVHTDGQSPSVFYRELQNIYCICHNHRRLYSRIPSIGSLLRVAKYLLHLPQSQTSIQTDIVRRYVTLA